MTVPCPDAADLRAMLDERLAGDYETVLLAHVDVCAACQLALEHITAVEFPSSVPLTNSVPGIGPPGESRAPDRLGPFRLEREIGRGGMGVVYLARHTRLSRHVAVKVIRAGAAATAVEVARFRTEAEALAAVQHPNIIQIFETGEHDQSAWIALEYIAGGSLRERLTGRPLPPRAAAQLMAGVARGTAAAHEHGIVHRDLKPGNVLLAAPEPGPVVEPIPKVTDFGLARLTGSAERLTQTGTAIGTPHYMAPEQARGELAGPPADIYAIGAMLYECLTGRPPFDAPEQFALLNQVIQHPPVPVRRLQPSVPRDLETICLKCLEKSTGDRYDSAGALAADLERYLAGHAIAARPVSWLGHSARWCRRNPGPASLVAALLLAVAAGGAGITWKWRAAVAQRQRAEELATAEQRAKEAAEEALRMTTDALTEVNSIVYDAAFRLKYESPDAAHRALLAGLEREAQLLARAGIDDPKLRYRVHSSTGHAYRMLLQYPAAIREAEACLADAEVGFGPASLCVVAALIELAALHELNGDRARAADCRQRGLSIFADLRDPNYSTRFETRSTLTYWREWAGEPELAVRLAERLVADARRQHGPEHSSVFNWTHELAWAELRANRFELALRHEREAALGTENLVGVGHKLCKGLAENAQALMALAGRTDADLFAFVGRNLPGEATNQNLLAVRGAELLQEQRWSEAEPILRECLERRAALEPTAWTTFNARSMLGECLLGQKSYAEAEPLLLAGYRGLKEHFAAIPVPARIRLVQAAERLVRLYEATDRPAEAAHWRRAAIPPEMGPPPRVVSQDHTRS